VHQNAYNSADEEETMTDCPACHGPGKTEWPPPRTPADLYTVAERLWGRLAKCEVCGRLWVEATYEPYDAFGYWVLWPFGVHDWEVLRDLDDGLTARRLDRVAGPGSLSVHAS
jgi:hypothetical protein